MVMPLGCYSTITKERLSQHEASSIGHYLQPFSSPGNVICFDRKVHWHFLSLLLALEFIALVWFGMILQVAWKVVKGHGADDSRSDSEEDEEDEKEVNEGRKEI